MKVLMTADAVGGVWTYCLELCRELASHDIAVVLAVMGPAPSQAQLRELASMPTITFEHAPWKLEWMDEPWSDVERAGEWLLAIAERERVDLVHLNGYAHATLPWEHPVLVVAHSCVCSWWLAVHGERAPASWDRYRAAVAAGLNAATIVVAPTHSFLDVLREHYGSPQRTAVIRNARTGPHTTPRAHRWPTVFACGRAWDEAKNLGVLDAAVRQLPWDAYVAGSGISPDGRTASFARLKPLGVLSSNSVSLWYARAAIFAHPARYEPFGLAPLEAALHGCALVLSDLPTLRELWDGAAVFAPADDVHVWREHLQRLIEDTELRKALAVAALARARTFQPAAMGGAYRDLYRSLLPHDPVSELAVA